MSLPSPKAAGHVTATATDPNGNTSEFSACMPLETKFYALAPCRVVDTRNAVGPYGAPPLIGGGNRSFVLAGQCGIPAAVEAVSLNITVTQPTDPGDLILHPNGSETPAATTISYSAGQTRANNAVAGLGANGEFLVYCDQPAGTVQLIICANGYLQIEQ